MTLDHVLRRLNFTFLCYSHCRDLYQWHSHFKNAAKFLLQLQVYKLPRHSAADFWLVTSSDRTHEDMNVGIPCCPGHVGGRVRCVARPTCAVNSAFQDDVFVLLRHSTWWCGDRSLLVAMMNLCPYCRAVSTIYWDVTTANACYQSAHNNMSSGLVCSVEYNIKIC
jgi:hypothetical protein